jgi:hypothetical protein
MIICLCSCGFASDDTRRFTCHLVEYSGHFERVALWYRILRLVQAARWRVTVRG